MELSPGAGKALALIGLVPVAYTTHVLERALPDLAHRAQELGVNQLTLLVPAALMLVVNIGLLRSIWEGRRYWPIVFTVICIRTYWKAVFLMQPGATTSGWGFNELLGVSLIISAVVVGIWLYEKKYGPLTLLPRGYDDTKADPPQPSTEPSHVTMPK